MSVTKYNLPISVNEKFTEEIIIGKLDEITGGTGYKCDFTKDPKTGFVINMIFIHEGFNPNIAYALRDRFPNSKITFAD